MRTKTIELTNYHRLPAGHNASVAVMSYSGYDIEDAIILNRNSLDRGFGMVASYRRYQTDFKKYPNGVMEGIKAPDCVLEGDKKLKGARKKYRAVDIDGLGKVGEKVSI